MRKKMFMVIGLLLVTMLTCQLFAVITGDPVKTYGFPMLITNAGQGPGGKMTRQIVADSGFVLDQEFFYISEPEPENLPAGKYSCLLVVIGSTDKGLGASGITIDDEIERLERMLAHAKSINLPIIAILMESDKRSKIPTNANERCIDLVCPQSEWMIVVKQGNTDNRFDELSAKYNIPLTVYSKAPMDLMTIFKQMLPK